MNLEQTINDRPYATALFFGCLATVLFHPIFLGKFVLGGTDVLYAHYPNILYGYREFQEFGSFSLWNRYIFSGMDFTGSMHAHFLNPLYWPLLLFPEKYVFHALTAGFMAMNALIGWLWFLISARLGVRGSGAVLVGVVAQAGMFFWFAMTTLIAVPMYLFASIAIYLILTHESRSALANYLGLSITFGLLFVTPHPSYLLGFSLPILVVFMVSCFPGWLRQPWRGITAIFVTAGITGILLAAYRLVPVALALLFEGNLSGEAHGFPGFFSHANFGLTAFNPIALGIHFTDSIVISEKAGFGGGIGRHTQVHNALYFGVAPLILSYFSVRIRPSAATTLLAVSYVAFQLSYLFAFQPISDFLYLLFYPIGHEGLFRTATNFAFLFLLVFGFRDFSCCDPLRLKKVIREVVIILGLIILTALILYARLIYATPTIIDKVGVGAYLNGIRLVIVGLIVGVALISRLPTYTLARPRAGIAGVWMGGALFAMAALAIFRRLPEVEGVVEAYVNSMAAILASVAIVLLAAAPLAKWLGRFAWGCIIAAFVLFLVPMPVSLSGREVNSSYWAAIAAWGAFIALSSATLNSMARFATGKITAVSLMQVALLVTVVDLIGAYGSYSYVNVPYSPFVRQTDIYPNRGLQSLVNRFNSEAAAVPVPDNLLSNPGFRRVSGQLEGWALGGKGFSFCEPSIPQGLSDDQGAGAACICYPTADGEGNMIQDVVLRVPSNALAMGVWIRAVKGVDAEIFMTTASSNASSSMSRMRGNGSWQWLESQLVAEEPMKTARPHIRVAKVGCIEVYAPRLSSGLVVHPSQTPPGNRDVLYAARPFPVEVDLDNYRVNRVDLINRYSPGDLMSNLAMIFRTPTYAGVDSDISRDYLDFLRTFPDESAGWYNRAGILSSRKNDRLLDLLGVAYDISESGATVIRPNAIPRIAAFRSFEVQDNRQLALKRLNDGYFDPMTTVILDSDPGNLGQDRQSKRFRKLSYETIGADRLSIKISADVPRLILFNDRFSSNWQAKWNNQPLGVFRANTFAMAVAIPDGPGELTFRFRPKQFLRLSGISAVTVVLLLLLGAVWIGKRFHKPPES